MKTSTASRWDKGLAVAFLATLAAEQQDFPNKAVWEAVQDHASWVIPSSIILAGFFSLGPFTARAEHGLVVRRTEAQRDALSEFGHILTTAQQAVPNLQLDDVGLHVWRVRRRLLAPWSQYLQRISTYRIGGSLVLRQFEPAKGVGVVGMCWKYNRDIDVNVDAVKATAWDEARFRALLASDPDTVMGLSWEEFSEISHRGSVFASPLRGSRQKFRGCVSLDFARDHADLKSSEVPGILNTLTARLSGRPFEEL